MLNTQITSLGGTPIMLPIHFNTRITRGNAIQNFRGLIRGTIVDTDKFPIRIQTILNTPNHTFNIRRNVIAWHANQRQRYS